MGKDAWDCSILSAVAETRQAEASGSKSKGGWVGDGGGDGAKGGWGVGVSSCELRGRLWGEDERSGGWRREEGEAGTVEPLEVVDVWYATERWEEEGVDG